MKRQLVGGPQSVHFIQSKSKKEGSLHRSDQALDEEIHVLTERNKVTAQLAMTIPHDPSLSRIVGVDILRAIAALFVLVYHARAEFWVGMRATLESPSVSFDTAIAVLLWPFSLGWLGVPVFFLLSGYCIHLSAARRLARGEELRFRFLPYMRRRILRIYPVFLAALLLTALLDWLQSGLPITLYASENAWDLFINTFIIY